MKNRTIEIKVRLSQNEADALNKRVEKSRLSREAYIRQLITGYVPLFGSGITSHRVSGANNQR